MRNQCNPKIREFARIQSLSLAVAPPPRRLAALSDLSAVRPLASGRDSWPRVETVESTTVLGDGGTDPTPPARKREESGLDVG